MKKIIITRINEGTHETLGHGAIYNENAFLFGFVTLELPNKHNKRNISSIPAGTYKCEVITRTSGKKAILIKDVPGRSSILIHKGNYYTDIEGCIIVGTHYVDINTDGVSDVANSTITMNELLSYCPAESEEFEIQIKKLAL